MRKAILAAMVLFLIPAGVQAVTLEDLLIEKGMITKGEAQSVSAQAPAKIYWKEGTAVEFPQEAFTMKITTFMQSRYEYKYYDSELSEDNTSGFSINRARLIFSGTVLDKQFSYKLEPDFVGKRSEGESTPYLRDGYLAWQPKVSDDAALTLKVGQFKTALSREANASDAFTIFPDRTDINGYFDFGRQYGAHAGLSFDDAFLIGA